LKAAIQPTSALAGTIVWASSPTLTGNTTPVILPVPAGCTNSYPKSVAVNGATVYVVGFSHYVASDGTAYAATQWTVNAATGAVTETRLFVTDLSGRYDSQANSVYVFRNNVYVAGYVMDYGTGISNQERWKIVTWKNGVKTEWGNPSSARYQYNKPSSIFVTDK